MHPGGGGEQRNHVCGGPATNNAHKGKDAYSEPKKAPLVPIETGHCFRLKEATPSDAKRPSASARRRDLVADEETSRGDALVEEIEGDLERDVECRHLLT